MRTLLIAAALIVLNSSLVSAPTTGPTASPCNLSVSVPVGATLIVNGARTAQMTAVRRFISPPLPLNGKFYYTFVASYTVDGEPVVKRKRVEVKAGATVTVDMLTGEDAKIEMPKPAMPRSPFEAPKKEPN